MNERIEVRMTPALLMFILLERGCENFTSTHDCIDGGRHPLAKYGADQMCDPCMAKLAQQGEEQQLGSLLSKAASLWLETHPRPDEYATSENGFLGEAERAYFRASK